jgi:hypothetical protein
LCDGQLVEFLGLVYFVIHHLSCGQVVKAFTWELAVRTLPDLSLRFLGAVAAASVILTGVGRLS